MKVTNIIALAIIASATTATLQAKPKHSKKKKRIAERNAIREEMRNDRKDTHGGQALPGKDIRPKDIHSYTKKSYSRIITLLKTGQISEIQGKELKTKHSAVVAELKKSVDNDSLTNGKKEALRNDLDNLNDSINKVVKDPDQGDKRTPIANLKQHKFEEMIEYGLRSGRLSNGEASRLGREVERLAKLEARYKKGAKLSTKERTKIHEEIIEVRREIVKELRD